MARCPNLIVAGHVDLWCTGGGDLYSVCVCVCVCVMCMYVLISVVWCWTICLALGRAVSMVTAIMVHTMSPEIKYYLINYLTF